MGHRTGHDQAAQGWLRRGVRRGAVRLDSGYRPGCAVRVRPSGRRATAALRGRGRGRWWAQAFPLDEDIDPHFSERVPLPAEVVGKIAAVSDVDRAVGDVSVPIDLVSVGGPAVGQGWSSAALTPFSLRAGNAPGRVDEVVLDADLARRAGVRVGDGIDLALGSSPATYTVTGVAAPPGADRLGRQPVLFFSDNQARLLSGRPDQVDTIGVLARPGTTGRRCAHPVCPPGRSGRRDRHPRVSGRLTTCAEARRAGWSVPRAAAGTRILLNHALWPKPGPGCTGRAGRRPRRRPPRRHPPASAAFRLGDRPWSEAVSHG